MSIELNKESVEQADASSCQGTNCGTTTGDHSSECLAEAAAGQGWELKPGDLCGRDCPIHKILVEQAGGDERAAFEAYRDRRNALLESEGHNPGSKWHVTNAHYPTWEASRAALGYRAPEVCSECSDTGKVYEESGDGPWSCYACTGNPEVIGYANGDELDNMLDDRTAVLSPGKTSFHTVPVYRLIRAALAQPSPAQAEQAEAELPEVVARVVHSNPFVLDQCGPLNANDELMTVAQHAASVARWAEMFNRVEQQRDAALARVAELERGKVYVEARQCDECQHGGINDSATGVAACHECDWTGPEPEEDRCPGCQRENCMAAACPQCGGRYVLVASEEIAAPVAQAQQLNDLDKQCRDDVARALGLRPNQERGFAWSYLLASIKSCVKASGDSAQAQHSVPAYVSYTTQPAESLAGIALRQLKDESRWVEIRDINAHAFPDMRPHSYYPAGTVIKLPAAAPGKEGV